MISPELLWVYLLKSKTKVSHVLISFLAMIQRQFNHLVKIIRSDNGTEFTNNSLQQYCWKEGILNQFSCTSTPQQNGIVEVNTKIYLKLLDL